MNRRFERRAVVAARRSSSSRSRSSSSSALMMGDRRLRARHLHVQRRVAGGPRDRPFGERPPGHAARRRARRRRRVTAAEGGSCPACRTRSSPVSTDDARDEGHDRACRRPRPGRGHRSVQLCDPRPGLPRAVPDEGQRAPSRSSEHAGMRHVMRSSTRAASRANRGSRPDPRHLRPRPRGHDRDGRPRPRRRVPRSHTGATSRTPPTSPRSPGRTPSS